MAKILTAERVSRDISDNYVFQRSQLAYHEAARRISGDVLEIGTGAGYGIEIVAPHASSFLTLDKIEPAGERPPFPHVEMRQAVVPPLDLPSGSFDYVISFQVIEHIKHDMELVREVHRVLRPGGRLLVLEFSKPSSQMLSKFYDTYSFNFMPLMGKLITNDSESYRYLAESIRMHPDQETLKAMMSEAGFERTSYHNMTGGIVALHRGIKP